MMGLTSQEIERLNQRNVRPVGIEGREYLIEMHGRTIRCSRHDLHRLAAPSLRERLRGQIDRLSRAG